MLFAFDAPHGVRRDLYVQYTIHASHAGLHTAAKTPQSIKRFSIVLWKIRIIHVVLSFVPFQTEQRFKIRLCQIGKH